MPKQRQRVVFCDCLDCADPDAGRATDVPTALSPAGEAAARQDPPPKCLLILLTGALRPAGGGARSGGGAASAAALDGLRLPHLDRAARGGCQSLLALRDGGAEGPHESLSELAQLLGVHEEWRAGAAALPQLRDRFQGMALALLSNQPAAAALASAAGAAPARLLQPDSDGGGGGGGGGFSNAGADAGGGGARGGGLGLPSPEEAAREALAELGLQSADSGLDMLVIHVDVHTAAQRYAQSAQSAQHAQRQAAHTQHAQQQQQQQQQQEGPAPTAGGPDTAGGGGALDDTARAAAEWADRVLRYLNNSPAFRDAVLLAFVLTPAGADLGQSLLEPGGAPLQPGAPVGAGGGAAAAEGEERGTAPPVPRPLQSWQQLGGAPAAAGGRAAALCVRRLPGVVRVDGCARVGLGECLSRGGMGGMLADRLLPEIAYKVGRAPKYGA
ncbi:MAG: hypothetical protein J3K34DRAFT_508772 [Monoraphidium minutum]|nr:MAG: hypothetical protein J3K34DRAFT_508772 [Monoraphidium minutum]